MDANSIPSSYLIPQLEAPVSNSPTLSPHSQPSTLQSTSLATVDRLPDELQRLFPRIDLRVPGVNHFEGGPLQNLILEEITRRLLASGQLANASNVTASNVPIATMSLAPAVPTPSLAPVLNGHHQNIPSGSTNTTSNNLNLHVPSPVKTEQIKIIPKYVSGSEYFPSGSDSCDSNRSSSPEEPRKTFRKKLLNKKLSPRSNKLWLTGLNSKFSGKGKPLTKEKKAQGRKLKKEREQSEKDPQFPKVEDSVDDDMASARSLHDNDDILPHWLRRDMDVLRRTLLASIGKNVDSIVESYLANRESLETDEVPGNDFEKAQNGGLNNFRSRIRARTKYQSGEFTIQKENDLRPLVQEHFRALLFPGTSRTPVPWKKLGIWLYWQRKKFTNWDTIIPTTFWVSTSGYPFFKGLSKSQLCKLLLVNLEDWAKGEGIDLTRFLRWQAKEFHRRKKIAGESGNPSYYRSRESRSC